jgi:hypothetical protein
MQQGMDIAVNATSEMVKAKAKAALEATKKTVGDSVVSGMRPAVVDALQPIWLFNLVVFLLLFVANLFIPSIPLKSKQDPSPEMPAPASH